MSTISSRIVALLLATFLTAIAALSFADAEARAITYDLNIPAEDLTPALQSFAIASHHKLLYKTELTAGKNSAGLKGQFTAAEAMERLLTGTGLTFEITGSSVVLIRAPTEAGKTGDLVDPARPRASARGSETRVAQSNQNDDPTSAKAQQQSVLQYTPKRPSQEEQKTDLAEIVVTGTHIHDVPPITPIMTITHDEIVRQGYTTLADVIDQLPQNFLGGASPSSNPLNSAGGSLATNNQTFASGINLRGLGPNATLVLVNGRRMAPAAFAGFADISNIPVNIIDRIEILTDGASSVYGADAVAGVVNIITRREFSGVQVDAGLTGVSKGKTPDHTAGVLTGLSWGGGGVVASADYEKDNPLYARNRSFSEGLPDPWALTPKNEKMNLYVSMHQELSDALTLSGDGFVARRNFYVQANQYGLVVTEDGRANQYSGSLQLDYRISPDWTAALIGQVSREQDQAFYYLPGFDYAQQEPASYKVVSIDSRIEGKLFDAPAGAVRTAVGVAFLQEKFEEVTSTGDTANPSSGGVYQRFIGSRHVSSAYGELSIPLVGKENAVPFVTGLRMNVSGRYDNYSDFGHTSNPRLALEWEPGGGVKVHASYSRSFQVPTFPELSTPRSATVEQMPDPKAATGSTLVVDTSGGNPNLQPETAKSLNFGVTYEPESVEGLKLEATYFSVKFDNQIIQTYDLGFDTNSLQEEALLGPSLVERNPSLAQITQALNVPLVTNYAGGPFTPAPYVPSDIKAIVDGAYVNSATSKIAGEDLDLRYKIPETRVGNLLVDVDASYFNKYDFQIFGGGPSSSFLNTTLNPLRFRAKANLGWSQGAMGANARVNFSNSYKNTFGTDCAAADSCPTVSSWTTVDLSFFYSPSPGMAPTWLEDSRVMLYVTNVFDRAPPSMTWPPGTLQQGFDPLNANPLMRVFGITFSKRFGRKGDQR